MIETLVIYCVRLNGLNCLMKKQLAIIGPKGALQIWHIFNIPKYVLKKVILG